MERARRPDRRDPEPARADPTLPARRGGRRVADRAFRFAQWEFAGRLGPEPGRYVVRRYAGDTASHVVVIAETPSGRGPEERRWRLGRREGRAGGVPPGGTRATVIDAHAMPEADARAWLYAALEAGGGEPLEAALAVVNRAVHGHVVAARDPYARELAPHDALVTRLGFGRDEDVAVGRWTRAEELAPARPPRGGRPGPRARDRLAALLGGRDVALAGELLVLRARLDLDHGREREAALQLQAGLAAACAELESWREVGDVGVRVQALHRLEPDVGAAAAAALQGGLQPAERETLRVALAQVEAALRAWAAQTRS